jgi:hypothetical protein
MPVPFGTWIVFVRGEVRRCQIRAVSHFFAIIYLIGRQLQLWCTMSTTDTSRPEEQQEKQGKAPRAAPRKRGAVRQPGRPHKRLLTDVLSSRTGILQKKLQVLTAKKTLIAERLEAYEQEMVLRDNEAADSV